MKLRYGLWLIVGLFLLLWAWCGRSPRAVGGTEATPPAGNAAAAPATAATPGASGRAGMIGPIAPRRGPATRRAGVQRILIVSIDGLRPDVMLLADAPNLHALMKRGAYTMYARTILDAYTLPAHVSMLTGVPSEKHGVTWNDYIEDSYPNVPTLFELAKRKQFTCAIAVAKMKFIVLKKPGVLDWSFIADEDRQNDADVTRQAIGLLKAHRPDVFFVHLANVDVVGHASGWGSPQQLTAIHDADALLGQLLETLRSEKLEGSTLVLVSSDHGGSGRGHGPDDDPSRLIPWIVSGPGVRQGFDLTLLRGRAVRIEDTFATAAAAMGLDAPPDIEGCDVDAVYQPGELVHDIVPVW